MCVSCRKPPRKFFNGSTSVDTLSYLAPCVLRQAMSGAADALEASALTLPVKLALSVGGVVAMNAWPVLVGLWSLPHTERSASA